MRTITSLLDEYGESHQNDTNKLIHWICVPLIFWSITALLWSVKFSEVMGIHLNLAISPCSWFGFITFDFPLI